MVATITAMIWENPSNVGAGFHNKIKKSPKVMSQNGSFLPFCSSVISSASARGLGDLIGALFFVWGGGGLEGGKGVGNGGSVAVGSGMTEAPSAEAKGKRGSG
jgi:hypothetical protein